MTSYESAAVYHLVKPSWAWHCRVCNKPGLTEDCARRCCATDVPCNDYSKGCLNRIKLVPKETKETIRPAWEKRGYCDDCVPDWATPCPASNAYLRAGHPFRCGCDAKQSYVSPFDGKVKYPVDGKAK